MIDTLPSSVIGIFSLIVFTLVGVIGYQNKKVNQLYAEKDALQEKRLAEISSMADKYNESVGNFSTTIQLLTAKLKVKS